jgi:hypothetical protein
VIFAGKRHFVVFDRATAQGDKREFTWLLHVNAEGSTNGRLELGRNTALVRRPGAGLSVRLHSSDQAAEKLSKLVCVHYFERDRKERHAVLRASTKEQERADFLAVLSPLDPREDPPVVSRASGKGWLGVTLDDKATAIFRTEGDGLIGDERVSTDGFALYWMRDEDGEPDHVLAMGASRIWIGKKLAWSSKKPRSAMFRPERQLDGSTR